MVSRAAPLVIATDFFLLFLSCTPPNTLTNTHKYFFLLTTTISIAFDDYAWCVIVVISFRFFFLTFTHRWIDFRSLSRFHFILSLIFFRWITLQIVIKMFVPYFIVDPSIPRISNNFRKISDWKTDCMLLATAYHWICVWIHTWNINIFDEATCRECGSGSMPCGLSFIWFLQCLEQFVV